MQQGIGIADHGALPGHQVVVLRDQRSCRIEEFEHGVDPRQAELHRERGDDQGLASAQSQPVLVDRAFFVQRAVAGGSERRRPDVPAVWFRHVRNLEADRIGRAVGRVDPQAPQSPPRVLGHREAGVEAAHAAPLDRALEAAAGRVVGADRDRVRKRQAVVFGGPDRREPDALDLVQRPASEGDRDRSPGLRAERKRRRDDRQASKAEHVPAVAGAIDPLGAAVLVELEVVAARAPERVFEKRSLQVIVPIVVERDACALGVEQRQVAFQESAVLDRAQIEGPALALLRFDGEHIDIGEGRHAAVEDLGLERDGLRQRQAVVGLGLLRRWERIHVEQPRIRPPAGRGQGRDVRSGQRLGRDPDAASQAALALEVHRLPGQVRRIECEFRREGQVLADEDCLDGRSAGAAQGLEAIDPGVGRIFGRAGGGR